MQSHSTNSFEIEEDALYAWIKLGNVKLRPLVDTGSSYCYINIEYAIQLKDEGRFVPWDMELKLPNNTTFQVKRALLADVIFQGRHFKDIPFLMTPTSRGVVLGFKFLMCMNIAFSCDGETILLSNKCVTKVLPLPKLIVKKEVSNVPTSNVLDLTNDDSEEAEEENLVRSSGGEDLPNRYWKFKDIEELEKYSGDDPPPEVMNAIILRARTRLSKPKRRLMRFSYSKYKVNISNASIRVRKRAI